MAITKASSSAVAPGAKGQLVVGSATNDSAILAVGSNNTVLTADSSTATGVKWATVSAGGWTQLASGSLSGASVSLTSISQDYINLHLVINGAYRTSAGGPMTLTANSITNGQYKSTWSGNSTTVTIGSTTTYWSFLPSAASDMNSTANTYSRIYTFFNYNDGLYKNIQSSGSEPNQGYLMQNQHWWLNTDAISSIQMNALTGTFAGGNYILYGEK